MITANAGRYPISAQCEILDVPRSTYYSMRGRKDEPKQPDPLTPEVFLAYESNRMLVSMYFSPFGTAVEILDRFGLGD